MEPLVTTLMGQVRELAQLARKEIMRFNEAGAAVTWEKDVSPLTAADSASH